VITAFGEFALDVWKCLPSTALDEARFLLTTMMKSSHLSLLGLKKTRGMMLMKDEPDFASLEFVAFYSRLKPWLQKHGFLKPVLRRRSAYAVAKVRQQLIILHGVSDRYI
jgi:hypothetical protein